MSLAFYKKSFDAYGVERKAVVIIGRRNKTPYSREVEDAEGRRRNPTPEEAQQRRADCRRILDELFRGKPEVTIREGADNLRAIEAAHQSERGYIWTLIAKIKIAFAITAGATILVEAEKHCVKFSPDELQKNGQPAPYSPRLYSERWNPDHKAAGTFYKRNLFFLQVARDLDIEVCIP